MPTIIKPTIGRVLWFYPSGADKSLAMGGDGPLAATICHVHTDQFVNLTVHCSNGVTVPKTMVLLIQEGTEPPPVSHCTWMPYQIGQAKPVTQPESQKKKR